MRIGKGVLAAPEAEDAVLGAAGVTGTTLDDRARG